MYFLDADSESDDDINMENADENVNVAPKERSASLLWLLMFFIVNCKIQMGNRG